MVGTLGLVTVKAINDAANNQPIDEAVKIFKELVPHILKSGYQPNGDDEILNGRAGFLAAILTLR